MAMNRAVLLIPYYGHFHNYFPIWLQSAAYNKDFDFLFLSDIEPTCRLPENVTFRKKTFCELKADLQNCLGFEIYLGSYYKIGEFRPVLGSAYPEYIAGYEFWGYCDIDTVFGKISHFLTDQVMDTYDVLLSHGHFLLMRNDPKRNDRYRFACPGAVSYQKAYRSAVTCNFDEWGGISRIFAYNHEKMFDEVVFADLKYRYYDFRLAQGGDVGDGRIYVWDHGILTECSAAGDTVEKRERMYVHLQKRQMAWDRTRAGRYVIVPNRFLPGGVPVTASFIKKHAKGRAVYWDYVKRRATYLLRKARAIANEKIHKRGLYGKYDKS